MNECQSRDSNRNGTIRSFEKGLAGRGGWREEILPLPEIQTSFCGLFPIPPLGEGEHILGSIFAVFVANPFPPTSETNAESLRTNFCVLTGDWRKSKWGLSNGGLRPPSATRAQSSAIYCAHLCTFVGEKLEKLECSSLLKASFDRACVLTKRFPLPVPTPPPPAPHPLPLFPYLHRKGPPPHHLPEPDPKPLPQGHE